jgi:hypothetical protein
MKKMLIKIAVCLLTFIVTLFVASSIYNKGNTEMTKSMDSATLPLVHMMSGDIDYNYLHGMINEMDGSFLRDTITPLGEGRTLDFVIDRYGNTIDSISFEVRSIDGTRLVEKTDVTDYKETGDTIEASITIKDLIETGEEYNWILLIETGGRTVRYYTRIIDGDSYHTYEKLSYTKYFHDLTFDRENSTELVSYLESNSKGDNTTLSYVDIHCSLKQITWANLDVAVSSTPVYTISEMDTQTASIKINYRVKVTESGDVTEYNVVEYFRIRYTADRTYLLEYERTMNQLFDSEASVYVGNKIMLGIRDSEVQMMESDGGSILAFVNENQLFCYHADDKKVANIFSFYQDEDLRSNYDNHSIKILSVDETGTVRFIVYGYMNRGEHEGTIGIEVCEYNGMLNTVEELIFIPYTKSYATLKTDMEQLSYINKNSIFYIYLDGSILAIDLMAQSYTEIASNLQQGSFQVSDTDKMLVWQNTADTYDCTKLILMNLNTQKTQEISKSDYVRLRPLGFINEDLIYGVSNVSDISTDISGTTTIPMYAVYIQDEQGEVLKTYRQEGIYVTDATVQDNLISLTRVQKTEEGIYIPATDDQIVNNYVEDSGYNSSEVVATQNFEKIVQLVLRKTMETTKLKITNPLWVMIEGDRNLDIEIKTPVERYYVYGKYGIDATFTHEADAVKLAYSTNATVINQNGDYVWKKATRSTKNQIMAISGKQTDEDGSDLSTCLEVIMGYLDSAKNVQPMLNSGMSVRQILEDNIEDITVLDLTGVSLDAVLYYVNKDIPVLATLNDGSAMLVIGFNELNVVVMNPQNGSVYKIGINDATTMFAESGNSFITYINKE